LDSLLTALGFKYTLIMIKFTQVRLFLISLSCIYFTGCAVSHTAYVELDKEKELPPTKSIQILASDTSLFGQRSQFHVPELSDLFSLSDKAKSEFKQYSESEQNSDKQLHEKVYGFLQDFGWEFQYVDATSNSFQTYETRSGNCMSLALLTTALAKHAEVPIKYQVVRRLPTFKEFGSVTFSSQHVRSVITEPEVEPVTPQENKVLQLNSVFRAAAIIDYYPSRYNYVDGYVNENELIAMYYRNLAAEELGQKNYSRAYWLAKESLQYIENNIDVINTLGVIYRRLGDLEVARNLYVFGLQHEPDNTTLLRNYKVLLRDLGDEKQALLVAKKLEKLGNENPFILVKKANTLYAEKDYFAARKFYIQAIDVAPYLHQSYFGLAKTEYAFGNVKRAKKLFEVAYSKAYDDENRMLYRAKLDIFAIESEKGL